MRVIHATARARQPSDDMIGLTPNVGGMAQDGHRTPVLVRGELQQNPTMNSDGVPLVQAVDPLPAGATYPRPQKLPHTLHLVVMRDIVNAGPTLTSMENA